MMDEKKNKRMNIFTTYLPQFNNFSLHEMIYVLHITTSDSVQTSVTSSKFDQTNKHKCYF